MPDINALILGVLMTVSENKVVVYMGKVIFLSFTFNWFLVYWIGVYHHRRTISLYPLFHLCLPIFNIIIRAYTMVTIKEKKWGGSRAEPLP